MNTTVNFIYCRQPWFQLNFQKFRLSKTELLKYRFALHNFVRSITIFKYAIMDQQKIFIEMAVHSWNTQVNSTTNLLKSLSDDQLMQEISPGKNSGIYLLGHLTAYHDLMSEILGIGERTLPGLSTLFLQIPDSTNAIMPALSELRNYWKAVHERLDHAFALM